MWAGQSNERDIIFLLLHSHWLLGQINLRTDTQGTGLLLKTGKDWSRLLNCGFFFPFGEAGKLGLIRVGEGQRRSDGDSGSYVTGNKGDDHVLSPQRHLSFFDASSALRALSQNTLSPLATLLVGRTRWHLQMREISFSQYHTVDHYVSARIYITH